MSGAETTDWPYGSGVRRSAALLRAFQVEQTDPTRFYGLLARDSVRLVEDHGPVRGRVVLDVGAGRPEFAEAFVRAGARYLAVDYDMDALQDVCAGGGAGFVGRGEALAAADRSVDVAFASNIFEHVRRPSELGDELVRVTRRGGLVIVSYTNWLSPWGGHETSPYHYLGGARAIRRYTRRYGRPPKNRVGETLFRVSVAEGLRWARACPDATVVSARPRYYPGWADGVVRVPGLREVLTWNLLLVLRRT